MSCLCNCENDQNKERALMQSISSKMKSSTGLRYSDQLVANHVIESNLDNNNANNKVECQTLIEKDEKSEEGSTLFGHSRERDSSSFIIQIALNKLLQKELNFSFPPGLIVNSLDSIDGNIVEISYKILDTDYIFYGKIYQNMQDFISLNDLLQKYQKNFIGNNHVRTKVSYDQNGCQIIYFIAKTTYPCQQSTIIKENK